MNVFNTLVGIVAMIVALGLLFALPTWFLWNNVLVGAVNGVHEIGVWSAWGLNILSGIFFRTRSSKE